MTIARLLQQYIETRMSGGRLIRRLPYIALCQDDPWQHLHPENFELYEVRGDGYERKRIFFSPLANDIGVIQTLRVEFDGATGPWGPISHWAVMDSPTIFRGRCLASGSFWQTKMITPGDTVSIEPAAISVRLEQTEGLPPEIGQDFMNWTFQTPQAYTVWQDQEDPLTGIIARTDQQIERVNTLTNRLEQSLLNGIWNGLWNGLTIEETVEHIIEDKAGFTEIVRRARMIEI